MLQESKIMKDFGAIIEAKIAEKYSIGKELKMRDLPEYDTQRIEYENFKQSVKDDVNMLKKEFGLVL